MFRRTMLPASVALGMLSLSSSVFIWVSLKVESDRALAAAYTALSTADSYDVVKERAGDLGCAFRGARPPRRTGEPSSTRSRGTPGRRWGSS